MKHIQNIFLSVIGLSIVIFSYLFFSTSSVGADPVATHYWVYSGMLEAGNWSDGQNWSNFSGGVSCNCVPDSNSIVAFDGGGPGNVLVDVPVNVQSISFISGFSGRVTNLGMPIVMHGDFTVESPAMLLLVSGTIIARDFIFSAVNGNPTVFLGTSELHVLRDWRNQGVPINPETSTVLLTGLGLNQNIYGNNTFYNFVVEPDTTKFVGFQAGTNIRFNNNLVLLGGGPNDRVHIQSVNTEGIPVTSSFGVMPINNQSITIDYATVQHSENIGPLPFLVSLDKEVVEIVPFSTSGWFPETRRPGGVFGGFDPDRGLDVWTLANAVPRGISGEYLDNNANVYSWLNYTDIDAHLNQVFEASRPTYLTNQINFNPAIYFDGVDDYLTATRGIHSNALFVVSKPNTVISSNMSTVPSFYPLVAWDLSKFNLAVSSGGFALGGNFTNFLTNEILTYSNGLDYRVAQIDSTVDNSLVYNPTVGVFSSLLTDFETQEVFANGVSVTDTAVGTYEYLSSPPYLVGGYYNTDDDPCCFVEGLTAEIVSYSQDLFGVDAQKVHSYLALKYGITLDQSQGGLSYLASDGVTKMWDHEKVNASQYNQAIAGIGQDNVSTLYQTKSRSEFPGSVVTIGYPDHLENMEFLSWGHNGLSADQLISSSIESESFSRIQRIWQVQETGDVGGVNVFVNQDNLPNFPTTLYLLVANEDDFSEFESYRMILVGNEWQLSQPVNFSDQEYFTFGYQNLIMEFADAVLAYPEDDPGPMTQVFVQGELLEPVSFMIEDTTNQLAMPQGVSGVDYIFSNQTIVIPPGNYNEFLFVADVNLSIVPDLEIEPDEYIQLSLVSLSPALGLGDVTGDGFINNIHTYTIINDDFAGVNVNPIHLNIPEGDFSQYNIVLTNPVMEGEIVVIQSLFGSELEVSSGSGITQYEIVFNSENWNIPQAVVVWAQDDDVYTGIRQDFITHTIDINQTTDSNYLLIENVQGVTVTIWDNDIPPSSGTTTSSSPHVFGCTNPSAVNYNPAATHSGSVVCLFTVTSPEYVEYSASENVLNQTYIIDALSGLNECPYFDGYYKLGSSPHFMIARWQAFLNVLLGLDLPINGQFDFVMDAAVRQYHEEWKDVILTPWGHQNPTGYIYKTTNATGNSMIGCPLGTIYISETGEYFNADTYNSAYNLQAMSQQLRNALNINLAQPF